MRFLLSLVGLGCRLMDRQARPASPLARRVPVLPALAILSLLSCRPTRPAVPDRIFITVPYEVDTLDPHARNLLSNFALAMNLYEPLVTTNPDMEIEPCLASRWENPNLSTWVFHLRPGVRFHSGKPMTADDVVFSFQRLLSGGGLEISGYLLYIADVRAIGPLTVQIRTTRPLSVLLNKVRFVAIVPKGSTASSLAGHSDGTGPYKLAHWVPGQRVSLTRNDDYWGPRPAFRDVEFRLGRSPASALKDLASGKFQLGQCNLKSLEGSLPRPSRFTVIRRPSIFVKYLGYDLSRDVTPHCSAPSNPFKNILVRRAINGALDRRKLVGTLSTDAVAASQLVPSFIFGFNPRIAPPEQNLAASRELLSRAGYPGGFDVVLDSRTILADAAASVAEQLRQVGIRVRLRIEEDSRFFARLDRRESSFHLSRFGCLTGDISDILDNVLHSVDATRHFGLHNYLDYSNPEVDRAIEESAEIQGVEQRREALEQISARLVNDLVWIPLYTDVDVYAVDDGLSWRPRDDSLLLAAEIGPAGRATAKE